MTSITCIIPTLNEEQNIVRLLHSIKNQKHTDQIIINEVIVVDNGSTDNTVQLSKENGSTVYIKPDFTIGALRNFGASISKGDILFFLDADNLLGENVVCDTVNKLMDNSLGAICFRLRPKEPTTWVERTWYLHLKSKSLRSKEVKYFGSGAFGMRRDVWDVVGGFNDLLEVGEDTDLSVRIRSKGYKIFKEINIKIYNTGFPKTLSEFFHREFWHGDNFKTIITHKHFDFLTLYLLFTALSIIPFFLALFNTIGKSYLCLPFFFTIIPPLFLSFGRHSKRRADFLQLPCIYVIYIVARVLALFKLK